jgi:hypothetical protein
VGFLTFFSRLIYSATSPALFAGKFAAQNVGREETGQIFLKMYDISFYQYDIDFNSALKVQSPMKAKPSEFS